MSESKNKHGTLMREALALLQQDGRSLVEVHNESGINFHWLRKFKQGEFKDPSVNTVQTLWEYLKGKQLTLK